MTTTPPLLDERRLLVLLAVVCDQDRGESPFGWSAPAPPAHAPADCRHGEDAR